VLSSSGPDRVDQDVAHFSHAAGEDNQVRMKNRHHVGDSNSQVAGASPDRLSENFVTLASRLSHFARADFSDVATDQFVKSWREPGFQQSDGLSGKGRSADEGFQATSLPASAKRAIGHDSLVPEFSRRAEWSQNQFSIDRDSAADSGSESQHRHRVDVFPQPEAEFAQRGRARVVQ